MTKDLEKDELEAMDEARRKHEAGSQGAGAFTSAGESAMFEAGWHANAKQAEAQLSIAREALEEIDDTYDQHGMGSPEASILRSIAVKALARLQAKEGNVVKIEDHLIDPQAHGQPGHVPSVGCPECLRGLQAKEEGTNG